MGRAYAMRDDKNSDTPQAVRVKDMESCIRYVYREQGGFKCRDPQSMGICSDKCPLKQVAAHPMAAFFGLNL